MDMPRHLTSRINPPLSAGQPADMAMSDWGELLNAVTQRLDQTAQEATLQAHSRLGMLDCVAALAQLQHAAKEDCPAQRENGRVEVRHGEQRHGDEGDVEQHRREGG